MTDPIYRGQALPRTPGVVDAVAESLGCHPAAVGAVISVEARSRGFYDDGRLVMLPEAHVAYRLTSGYVRDQLVKAGAAGPYGTVPYPYSVDSRYRRFDTVAEIAGLEVACLSCSWGLPQGMGFNHSTFGYDSAEAMVRDFAICEDNQIVGMANFIRANGTMHRALVRRDWATFARAYNGPRYRENKYDERLAAAFYALNGGVFTRRTVRLSDKNTMVGQVQKALIAHGYRLRVDNDFGQITLRAVKDFQRSRGLTPDGVVGERTATALGIVLGG